MTRPEFAALGQSASGGLQALLTGGLNATTPYSGPMTSTILPGAQQALGGIQQAAMDPARQALIQQTLGGTFLPGQSGANPFLASAIQTAQAPTALALENALQRRIPSQALAAGQTISGEGSSPYMRELGQAAFLGGRALGDIATTMSSAAYEAERQRQQQAIQLGQQDVQAMLANVQAQWLPQAIQEQGIDRAISTGQSGLQNLLSAFQIAQGYPLQPIAASSTSFGQQGSQGTSTQQGSATASSNLLGGLFGNQGVIPYLFGNPSGQTMPRAA